MARSLTSRARAPRFRCDELDRERDEKIRDLFHEYEARKAPHYEARRSAIAHRTCSHTACIWPSLAPLRSGAEGKGSTSRLCRRPSTLRGTRHMHWRPLDSR